MDVFHWATRNDNLSSLCGAGELGQMGQGIVTEIKRGGLGNGQGIDLKLVDRVRVVEEACNVVIKVEGTD